MDGTNRLFASQATDLWGAQLPLTNVLNVLVDATPPGISNISVVPAPFAATVTWTTSDDFQLVSGKPAQPNAITTDSNGKIYVSGRAQDANGVDQWIVRKLTP